MKKCLKLTLVAGLILWSFVSHANLTTKTIVQLHAVHSEGIDSWLERGTGQTRYDAGDNIELGQALMAVEYDTNDGLSLNAVAHYQTEQDAGFGISQFYAKYKPLWSPVYHPTFKVGLFYPEMSFENVDTGWLSPYTYSFSAINSWIAEEQRTAGIEVKVDIKPAQRTAHSFSITAATFKGNDTLGSILSWRGWAIHDKQSVLNETIRFATYPSIGPGSRVEDQAAWVEPNREIDGRFGYYLGSEWDYKGKSKLRYFYYDNNGDNTLPVAARGQYVWKTRYHSLAWQYRFNQKWRLIAQTLYGNTEMGRNTVNVDFTASYVMLNYSTNKHRVSARYDTFRTSDVDDWKTDINSGDGNGITLTYKYLYSSNWQFGLEYLVLDSLQANRGQWPTRDLDVTQRQLSAALDFRF